MGMLSCGAKAERLPRAGLPRHKGFNTGRTCVPDAVQHGGGQRHKNLDVHEGRIPEGGSLRAGRDRWAVLGSLLCQQWHGRITRLRLAAARNEHPSRPLHKVWPGGQRCKVTQNQMPSWRITGGVVGGGHFDEVHRVGDSYRVRLQR